MGEMSLHYSSKSFPALEESYFCEFRKRIYISLAKSWSYWLNSSAFLFPKKICASLWPKGPGTSHNTSATLIEKLVWLFCFS